MLIFEGTCRPPEYWPDDSPQRFRVTVTTDGGVAGINDASGAQVEHLAKADVTEKGNTISITGNSKYIMRGNDIPPSQAKTTWRFTDIVQLAGFGANG